jgi:hypothetical protein
MSRFVVVLAVALCCTATVMAQTSPSPSPSTPGPATDAAPKAAPSAAPADQEILYQGEAQSILGRSVLGSDDHAIGLVVDVLVDEAGQPRAAVIDFGGFLGIGNRRVAVVWRALRFAPSAHGGTIAVDLTAEQLRTTPEYQAATKPVMMAVPPAPVATPAAPQAAKP